MRLLFVHDKFGAFGGAEANVLATAGELRRRGHELGILHGPATGRDASSWEETFSTRQPLPAGEAVAVRVTAAIAAFAPEAIFIHKLSDPDALEALAGAGRPVVRMVHDHDLYCLRGYKYHPLTRRICTRALSGYCVFPCGGSLARRPGGGFPLAWISLAGKRRELAVNRRFARMIVATEYMRQELLRNGCAPAQVEIHAPVPRPMETGGESSFGPANRLVYAGQIVRGKGVDVLLQALARVQSRFDCVILGDGSHRAKCEALSRRLGLADRVRFAGFVPQAELARHYQDASIALMSSVWPEPFGAVGLEALRGGVPVVAFDAGGIREWLIDGQNGLLIPWMDRDRYAAAIDTLLRDKPLARRLGAQGRRLVEERHGFADYITGLERLFERLRQPTAPAAAAA